MLRVQRNNMRNSQTSLYQERYRTAGRVLQERADRRVLAYATGGSSAARRAPAKRDRSVNKKKFRHRATRFCTALCGEVAFCKERYEGVYCVLDRMSDDSRAQDHP